MVGLTPHLQTLEGVARPLLTWRTFCRACVLKFTFEQFFRLIKSHTQNFGPLYDQILLSAEEGGIPQMFWVCKTKIVVVEGIEGIKICS
jgi:hypothetical protein